MRTPSKRLSGWIMVLSAAFSLEEGWTVVRRKEKKDAQKEENNKEGKGTQKELCKVQNSQFI